MPDASPSPEFSNEIEEILVDCYDEQEQMAAWGVTFEDGITVPFSATLLGTPVEVIGFRTSDNDVLQAKVVRDRRERWIAVEDLDDEGLPDDMSHMLRLYRAWLEGDY